MPEPGFRHAQGSRDAVAEHLILGICAGNPASDQAFTALDDRGWNALEATAVRTRTACLLHRHIVERDLAAPDTNKRSITDLYRSQSLYSLGQRIVLGQLADILGMGGIEHVALKGSALAYSAYAQPAMRPLRDIDVLVPASRAQEAYDLLRHHGFTAADWAGDYGTERFHQLPELISPKHDVTVEIHHRIFSRDWPGDSGLTQLLLQHAQGVLIGSATARLADPLSNLLHLTVHATLHNCFENGPLTISDVRLLWNDAAMDRERVIQEAQRLHLTRPLALLIAIMRDLTDIDIPAIFLNEVEAASPFVPHAMAAMFRTPAQTEARDMARRLEASGSSAASPLAAMRRMVTPTAQQLADIARTRATDPARWKAYPAWAWDRGQRWIGNLVDRSARADAQTDARMLNWLRNNEPGP